MTLFLFNDLLKKIVTENIDLKNILKQKSPNSRYLDVEFILRGFALADNLTNIDGTYLISDYKGKMVKYLNDYMGRMKTKFTIEMESIYLQRFNEAYKKIILVFGTDQAFRDISSKNNKIYKALMDIIFVSFDKISFEILEKNKSLIYKLLLDILNENQIFRDSITYRTSDKDVLNKRVDLWMKELESNGIF